MGGYLPFNSTFSARFLKNQQLWQGSLNYLFGGDQTMQMYGDFGRFPLYNDPCITYGKGKVQNHPESLWDQVLPRKKIAWATWSSAKNYCLVGRKGTCIYIYY